jgi:hypothetical protein
MHDEQQVLDTRHCGLGEAQFPQSLGSSPLHEFQVIDVVNDAAGIGVLVINATTMCERLSPVLRAHTLVLTPQVANPARQLFLFVFAASGTSHYGDCPSDHQTSE